MHIYFITLLLIFYLLYIQYSPGIGNIWYRNNEYYSPMGAVKMISAPLHLHYMWYPSMWDINFFLWILAYIVLMILLHKIDLYKRQYYTQ